MAEPELVTFCNLAEDPTKPAPEDAEAGGTRTEVDQLFVAIQVEENTSSSVQLLPPATADKRELASEEMQATDRLLDDGGGGGKNNGSCYGDEADGGWSQPAAGLGLSARRITASAVSYLAVTSTRVVEQGGRLHTAGRNYCRRSLGLLVALLSGILMVAYSSMIKILEEMDSMQVVIIRGLMQMLIFGAIALYKRLSFRGEASLYTLLMLVIVSVTGGLRMLFIFISFSRLPLGDSTAIIFSSPVFVMMLSVCVLKESCGIFRIAAGSTLIAGVLLVTKPPIIFPSEDEEETYDVIGYILVCLACLTSAAGMVLTKLITKRVEKTVILFYLGLASALCGTVGLFSVGQPSVPALWEWLVALGVAVLGLVQQYCLVYAVHLESPSRVSVVRQFQIVIAYVVQVTFFEVIPKWMDMVGASLILVTVITVSFEKQIESHKCCNRKDKAKQEAK